MSEQSSEDVNRALLKSMRRHVRGMMTLNVAVNRDPRDPLIDIDRELRDGAHKAVAGFTDNPILQEKYLTRLLPMIPLAITLEQQWLERMDASRERRHAKMRRTKEGRELLDAMEKVARIFEDRQGRDGPSF
jgi:hypothetical protein